MEKKLYLTISEKYVDYYKLPSSYIGKDIVLYDEKWEHIEKHKEEFVSDASYNYSISNMSNVISSPDFISLDSKNNSLLFVKKLIDNTLVAVRTSDSNDLKIKTMYPINSVKYERLKKGKLK